MAVDCGDPRGDPVDVGQSDGRSDEGHVDDRLPLQRLGGEVLSVDEGLQQVDL